MHFNKADGPKVNKQFAVINDLLHVAYHCGSQTLATQTLSFIIFTANFWPNSKLFLSKQQLQINNSMNVFHTYKSGWSLPSSEFCLGELKYVQKTSKSNKQSFCLKCPFPVWILSPSYYTTMYQIRMDPTGLQAVLEKKILVEVQLLNLHVKLSQLLRCGI